MVIPYFSFVMVASKLLAATTQVSARTPTPPAPKPPTHVHQGLVTPAERQAAAPRAAKARGALGPISAQYALTPGVADYFGTTPNYAISPIPASVSIIGDGVGALYNVTVAGGVVTGFTMVSPGSGYTVAATTITGIGGGGTGDTGTILTQDASGGITSIAVGLPGSGYSVTYGIRKFADTLPQLGVKNDLGEMLSVAVPDTTTYPGADYYEITLEQFNWQFHTDLTKTPGTVSPSDTLVRGYVQTNVPTPVYDYLGPVIVAHAGRPVRIKFFNKLPT